MIVRILSALAISASLSMLASASPSINDISTCQATVAFVAKKANELQAKYGATDVETVSSALTRYHDFLQTEHMAPGLSALNSGDVAKTEAMQGQIDEYQDQLGEALTQKFPQARLFAEHAVLVNNCYALAPMGGAGTAKMKIALETLIRLAKQE
jgi:hypothetical protein